MPDLSATTISSWTPLRIIWELMTNKVNNASNLSVFNSKIRSWALVNYPWWLCERFDKDLDFVIFLSSKRFEHYTKNEEILKGKLHFLCSGSRGKRMKEIVSITAELKGVIKVSFRMLYQETLCNNSKSELLLWHSFVYPRNTYPANFLANKYMVKVNNKNTRRKPEICLILTIKTPIRRQWRRPGVFIANFKHNLHIFLAFVLSTLNSWIGKRSFLQLFPSFYRFVETVFASAMKSKYFW